MLTKEIFQIPAASDIPAEFNVTLLRNAGTKEEAVYSSKGVGEPPLTLAVSVVCALREAVRSYRRDQGVEEDWSLEVPLTSERIRMACRDQIVSQVQRNITHQQEDFLNIIQ